MTQDRSGTTLGGYQLDRFLGRGGMGEVYAATDARLGRTVALKILRPEVLANREYRNRFEREAQALAALRHPGIVTIYALEEIDGETFFTMDLVEGTTLTEIIRKDGPLPLDRIFDLAIPICDAIAAAHKRGITHRDIKPDNVLVGQRDQVTVLDFGLAKNAGLQMSHDETIGTAPTMDVTVAGRIMGTVNYMAPEQAEGRETSPATDVFALGVVIYEMATGDLPFKGDSTMSILSSILRDSPATIPTHDSAVPPELATLVHRCLEKDPDRRWQSALDVRNELEILRGQVRDGTLPSSAAATVSSGEAAGTPVETIAPRRGIGWMVATLVFAVCAAVLGAMQLGRGSAVEADATATPVAKEIWTFDCLTSDPGMENMPSLSPDGEFIAFSMRASDPANGSSIYLLRVGGNRPIELTGDLVHDDLDPRFSPDGERIVFRSGRLGDADGALYVMGATGESRRRIDVNGYAPDWSPDGTRLVCSSEGYMQPHGRPTAGSLLIVDVDTGRSTEIFAGDAVDPRWSPDGEWIVFWTVGLVDEQGLFQITGRRDIGVIRADGTDFRLITDDTDFDWSPAWTDDGRAIVFSSNRGGPIGLWMLDFDPETGTFGTEPRPVPAPSTYAGAVDATLDGEMIVYVDGMGSTSINRVRLDPETLTIDGLPECIFDDGYAGLFDVAADGGTIVMTGGPMRTDDIYVSRGDGSGIRQVTDDAFRNLEPILHPDGRRIHFFSNRSGDYEGWTCGVDGGSYRMVTDGWRLIDTPTIHPVDGRLAMAVAGEWYLIPGDSQELPFDEVDPMPRVDDRDRWFSPLQFARDGRRILGLVRERDDQGPLDPRDVGIFDLETQEYEVFRPPLPDRNFTLQWAPDHERVLIGDRRGIWAYDPSTDEITSVMEAGPDVGEFLEFRLTDNGYMYYALPENERDIWLARRGTAPTLTRFADTQP